MILSAGALGMTALLCLLPATGHDQMWLLYCARQVLRGTELYGPELMESNPPLIVWISLLPAWLGEHAGLAASFFLKLLVLLVAAGSAWWAQALLQRVRKLNRAQTLWLLFSFVVLFGTATARDFGQRDHLLALLCLPYVASVAVRLLGGRIPWFEAVALGLAAGIGLCLKPHQGLLFLAMELLLIFRAKNLRSVLRPEVFLIPLCGAAYLAGVVYFTPRYIAVLLPLLRDCYWAIGHRTLPQLAGDAIELHILALAAFVLWLRAGKDTPHRTIATVFLLAGVASTLAYYAQGTGWYYQQLPAIGFFGLALAFLLMDRVATWKLSLSQFAVAGSSALVVLALALTTHFMGYPFTAERALPISDPDPALLSGLPAGTPIYIMTTDLDTTIPPVMKWNLTWASRMPHMWMLPAVLRGERHAPQDRVPTRLTSQRVTELDRIQHILVADDLDLWQPRIVLVERCYDPAMHCQVLEDLHPNLLAWFSTDAHFRDAFSAYVPAGSRGRFDVYERRGHAQVQSF
jgi:hypothetical protein